MATFKGFLDYSGGTWSLAINGTDYTPYVQPGSTLEWSLVPQLATENPSLEPILQIGQITLGPAIFRPLSTPDFDPTSNSDFKEENLVVFSRESVTVRARIAKASGASFDPETYTINSITLELTDKLGLINRDFPAPNPDDFLSGATQATYAEDISYGVQVWYEAIKKKLTAARKFNGTRYFNASDIITSGLPSTLQNSLDFAGNAQPDGFDSSQGDERNPAREAARIAALRGYFIYCDPATEQIKFTQYPINASDKVPGRIYPFAAVELGNPQISEEDPVDSTETVTTRKTRGRLRKKQRINEYPVVTTTSGVDPNNETQTIIVEQRIEYKPLESTTETTAESVQEYQIWKALFYAFPKSDTYENNTSFFLAEYGEIYKKWEVETNLPTIEGTRNIYKALGLWNEDAFPDETGSNNEPASDLTYYTYDSEDKRPLTKIRIVRAPLFSVLQDSTNTNIATVERYETPYKLLTNGKIWSLEQKSIPRGVVEGTESTTLIPDPEFNATSQLQDGIERPQGVRAEEDPPQLESESSNAEAESLGSSGGRTMRITLPGGSKQHANTYSKLAIAHSQDGRVTFSPTRPLENDESLTPFNLEIVGDRVLVRDGLLIEFDGNGAVRFGYTGRQKSKLTNAVTVPKRPQTPLGATLSIAAIPNRTGTAALTIGVPIIPVPLVAGGGTAPYTFSALSGLPTGLSVSGTEIIGTPSATGTGTATIQVTDNATNTDSTTFDWAVNDPDYGVSHYGFIYNVGTAGGGFCGYNIPSDALTYGTVGSRGTGYIVPPNNMVDDNPADNMIDDGGNNMVDN